MKNRDILKDVLKKFKLDRSLPVEVQKEMLEAKKNTFILILKRFGKYSFFMMMVVWLFYKVKKYGLVLSLAKSAYMIVVSIAMLVALISVGSYAAVKYISFPDMPQIKELQKEIKTDNKHKTGKQYKKKIKKQAPVISYKLGILPFSHYQQHQLSVKAANIIRNNLMLLKGKNAAALVYNANKNNTPKVLVGSIVELAGSYKITVKVVDSKNSAVLLYVSEQMQSKQDLNNICKIIASKIAKKI